MLKGLKLESENANWIRCTTLSLLIEHSYQAFGLSSLPFGPGSHASRLVSFTCLSNVILVLAMFNVFYTQLSIYLFQCFASLACQVVFSMFFRNRLSYVLAYMLKCTKLWVYLLMSRIMSDWNPNSRLKLKMFQKPDLRRSDLICLYLCLCWQGGRRIDGWATLYNVLKWALSTSESLRIPKFNRAHCLIHIHTSAQSLQLKPLEEQRQLVCFCSGTLICAHIVSYNSKTLQFVSQLL